MTISAKRELEILIAALLIDHERGDGKTTCIEALGYQPKSQPVIMAAVTIHDLVEAKNDPYILFNDNIQEYKDMQADGSIDLYRLEIQTRKKVGRNQKCPCGSGKKYKKCCGVPN